MEDRRRGRDEGEGTHEEDDPLAFLRDGDLLVRRFVLAEVVLRPPPALRRRRAWPRDR